MRRIAALVVAVALIVVALVIRNNRDEEKRRGPYRLTCATELAVACNSLSPADVSVTVEPAGVTTDRLIALPPGADPGFDGWLASGRWARIVADVRAAAGSPPITDKASVIGHTRVAVAAWKDRLGVLRQACGGTVNWRCIGDTAARGTWKASGGPETWGVVKIGLADPVAEGAGLAGLAAATAGFDGQLVLGGADASHNDAYLKWLTGLARAVVRPAPRFTDVLTAGPAVADVFVGLEADMTAILRGSARRNDMESVFLSPVLDIEATLVNRDRDVPARLVAAVREAGWTQDKDSASAALPANGGLAGLRGIWRDTVR